MTGRGTPGGIVIADAAVYDTFSRLLLGSFFGHVAADVASVVPHGARVLEVGCGPGHLSILLARRYGFDVTGLDLDPVMIERAGPTRNVRAWAMDRGRRSSSATWLLWRWPTVRSTPS